MHFIPPFYEKWLPDLAGKSVSEDVDCASCPTYALAFKCCTYFPYIPNFTLGQLLRREDPMVKGKLRIALQKGRVSALGLFESSANAKLREKLGGGAFGKSKDLLCPFFDKGACSIWESRPGVCVGFLCRSSHGELGLKLRNEIDSYLNTFEWTLANMALWRVGFSPDDVKRLEAGEWLEFQGREHELLKLTADAAMEISAEEVRQSLGPFVSTTELC